MFTTSIKKETILNAISQEEIFKRYCPNFKKINVKFSSEVRDDPKPSCVIAPYNGVLWYKDFGDTNSTIIGAFRQFQECLWRLKKEMVPFEMQWLEEK